MVDDMPDDLSAQLSRKHPAYKWKLAAIVLNPSQHRKWKNLARWEGDERERSVSARRSLCWQYGNTPLVLGYEFATTHNADGSWLAVRYDPELINKDETARFVARRETVLKARAEARGSKVTR